ncbi:26S proteasome regulatory subunit 8 like protein [Cucumispora dikerogammari]|nr:26S proteasome regulatory subunit 8 like protein [Cucumispora dikerogammari]
MFLSYYKDRTDQNNKAIKELEKQLEEQNKTIIELAKQINELEDELYQVNEPPSSIGTVSKILNNSQFLVEEQRHGKMICKLDNCKRSKRYFSKSFKNQPQLTVDDIKVGCRVALRSDNYSVHKLLPSSIDPLVSLMAVESVLNISYDQIGGLDKQIKEVREVIELPLKRPDLFENLGITQPKGVLLYGPPGTGKTLLARAVASQTNCKFIRVSGSELVKKFIGEGSRLVREIFTLAKEQAPSIIFIDEIDAIGSSRDSGDSDVQRTMLELVNQLDGFNKIDNVKVIMATNRLDILDVALIRPGRLDRKIELPNPSNAARLKILEIHTRKMNHSRTIDFEKMSDKMQNFSGAEVKGVCMEAGMTAIREGRAYVMEADFEVAVAKIKRGVDKTKTKFMK